jgi:hypothetical protein
VSSGWLWLALLAAVGALELAAVGAKLGAPAPSSPVSPLPVAGDDATAKSETPPTAAAKKRPDQSKALVSQAAAAAKRCEYDRGQWGSCESDGE